MVDCIHCQAVDWNKEMAICLSLGIVDGSAVSVTGGSTMGGVRPELKRGFAISDRKVRWRELSSE